MQMLDVIQECNPLAFLTNILQSECLTYNKLFIITKLLVILKFILLQKRVCLKQNISKVALLAGRANK